MSFQFVQYISIVLFQQQNRSRYQALPIHKLKECFGIRRFSVFCGHLEDTRREYYLSAQFDKSIKSEDWQEF